jgi:hypothetical protein
MRAYTKEQIKSMRMMFLGVFLFLLPCFYLKYRFNEQQRLVDGIRHAYGSATDETAMTRIDAWAYHESANRQTSLFSIICCVFIAGTGLTVYYQAKLGFDQGKAGMNLEAKA